MDAVAPPEASEATSLVFRPTTREAHRTAVERVVSTMRERHSEPLSLLELAGEAFMSPFHFNRVFRHTTGVPPGRFLAALRMQTAKRLLLTTQLRVTDVCFEVGYRSLGTFTTHFRQLVGVGPNQLRRLAARFGDVPLEALCGAGESPSRRHAAPHIRLAFRIRPKGRFDAVVFSGLFPTPLPQTRPAACAVTLLTAAPALACTAGDSHFALASAYHRSCDALDALLAPDEEVRVGATGPLFVGADGDAATVELELRRLGPVDPPILLALPLVLADAATAPRRRSGRARRASPQARVRAAAVN
jgi:AraC family transcriptional regulator